MKGGDRYVAKKEVKSIDEIRSATKMAIGYGVRRAAIVLGNEISLLIIRYEKLFWSSFEQFISFCFSVIIM